MVSVPKDDLSHKVHLTASNVSSYSVEVSEQSFLQPARLVMTRHRRSLRTRPETKPVTCASCVLEWRRSPSPDLQIFVQQEKTVLGPHQTTRYNTCEYLDVERTTGCHAETMHVTWRQLTCQSRKLIKLKTHQPTQRTHKLHTHTYFFC